MPKRSNFTGTLNIEASPAAPPERTGPDLSQFIDVVQDSWNAVQRNDPNPARRFTVPTAATTLVTTRLRMASDRLNVGVRVHVGADENGSSVVTVLAKPRRVNKPKDENGSTPAAAKPKPVRPR